MNEGDFQVFDGDEFYAEASGERERAWGEAMNYASQCALPRIEEVTRTPAPMGEEPPAPYAVPCFEALKWALAHAEEGEDEPDFHGEYVRAFAAYEALGATINGVRRVAHDQDGALLPPSDGVKPSQNNPEPYTAGTQSGRPTRVIQDGTRSTDQRHHSSVGGDKSAGAPACEALPEAQAVATAASVVEHPTHNRLVAGSSPAGDTHSGATPSQGVARMCMAVSAKCAPGTCAFLPPCPELARYSTPEIGRGQDDARDAARYRFLRDRPLNTSDEALAFRIEWFTGHDRKNGPLFGAHLDMAVDTARAYPNAPDPVHSACTVPILDYEAACRAFHDWKGQRPAGYWLCDADTVRFDCFMAGSRWGRDLLGV